MPAHITLPDLPYAEDALAPHISAQTLRIHHGAHHRAYVDTANRLLEEDVELGGSIERLIQECARDPGRQPLFNALAQSWNHAFFWKSMTPGGGGAPTGMISEWINDAGGYERIAGRIRQTAASLFGSGWVWVLLDRGNLEVRAWPNAGTPIVEGKHPLLAIDLWEHAYYLDYQNRRDAFVDAFLDHLVSWDFASRNLELAVRKDAYLAIA